MQNPYASQLGDLDPLEVIATTPAKLRALMDAIGGGRAEHPRSRRTGLLNKARCPGEKTRGDRQELTRALTRGEWRISEADWRGRTHRNYLAILGKTRRVEAGARRPLALTTKGSFIWDGKVWLPK